MSNPYLALVQSHDALLQKQDAPLFSSLAGLTASAATGSTEAPVVMIFAPHPDDECIIGALPLRLGREAGFKVINVAVTQGSNLKRQPERWAELKNACDYLGWDLLETIPGGLMGVGTKTRDSDPVAWAEKVSVVAKLIAEHKPAVCVFPHDNDYHSAHIGTHYLVVDALKEAGHDCVVALTEFWRQMDGPNALIATNNTDTADLIAALACHVEEVRRNPYHLRLPGWMADNVRRGAEVCGGQGAAAPTFSFGTIYKVTKFDGEKLQDSTQKYTISDSDDIKAVLA
ncbi:N-acetylglucosaminyl deacetylase, LmbE family [Andreprevotia lacus DSM 23236]|jgi:LmbE family N-acetylglucosaminyl deacetylase|uniref:N-acetylglucosaminyl deacetylase, LmbE family n=1 Tax=Andreprevotia lacus DSM 23236 TaxID=1121001 RepID=A0A1W1XZ68_9NEIS|nr:PIG-L family deacetylase [Andreprevotia lacus]SMC28798.1 N-acetylglucosaminyl deacetylase, LmbE family [Andreprevotia lacus DSM 23236]